MKSPYEEQALTYLISYNIIINTISCRLGYISANVRKVYDTKIEVIMFVIKLVFKGSINHIN